VTGSPFSNVVGHNPGEDSTFKNVESDQVGDTTTDSDSRPDDTPGEPSVPVVLDTSGTGTHEAEEDETAGQTDLSGTPTP
jgi:hypothetical protein